MTPKDRRPLTEGLRPEPEIDPNAALDFVYQKKDKEPSTPAPAKPAAPARLAAGTLSPAGQSALIPLTARIPAEKFQALKRASFERQLQGVEPSSMQDIVEEALTPWLRKHGYLA
ncbi:hypothetical protein BH10PLA2_BH10PLA2_19800 [soil metagenome]